MPPTYLPNLSSLLRAGMANYTESGDPVDGPLWIFDPSDALSPELVDAMAQSAAEHPVIAHFIRTGDPSALRISDVVRLREFQRLEIY